MDDELAYALHQMSVWDYQYIPLIDGQGRPTGVVSMRHIIDYLVEMFPQDVFNLLTVPVARYRATPRRSVKTWRLSVAHLAVDLGSRGTRN